MSSQNPVPEGGTHNTFHVQGNLVGQFTYGNANQVAMGKFKRIMTEHGFLYWFIHFLLGIGAALVVEAIIRIW